MTGFRVIDGGAGGDATALAARALDAHQSALRRLFAQMLRVARGAGRPCEIVREAFLVAETAQAHIDAVGYGPSAWEITQALERDPVPEGISEESQEFEAAEAKMVRGALQAVASELLGQRTQYAAGMSELHDGWRLKLDYVKRHGGVL